MINVLGKSYASNDFVGTLNKYLEYSIPQVLEALAGQIARYEQIALHFLRSRDKLYIADKIINPGLKFSQDYDDLIVSELKLRQLQSAFNLASEYDETLLSIVRYSQLCFIQKSIRDLSEEYSEQFDDERAELSILMPRHVSIDDIAPLDEAPGVFSIYFKIDSSEDGVSYKKIDASIHVMFCFHLEFDDIKAFQAGFGGKGYITLAEYARKHNVDASTIRKKILAKNLNAVKVGRDWLIKSDEPWVDLRLKK